MPTSKAGISTKRQDAGFTLLELVIIITILGITALMVFPKLSAFNINKGKGATRHLVRLIQHLAEESAATKQVFRLHYDLEENNYSVKVLQGREFIPFSDSLASGGKLPKGLSFEDIITPRHGKVLEGDAFTEFFPLGVEKTVIHLKDGERSWSLMINGLTGRVKVFDEYVDQYERTPL